MVIELEVSQGAIKDIQSGKKTIKVSDIISMSQEAIVVKATAEEETKKQSEEKGAKGVMTKLSSNIKEKAENIKENPKIKEMTQKVQEKAGQEEKKESVRSVNPSGQSPTQKTEDTVKDLKAEGIEIRKEKTDNSTTNLEE